MSRTVKTSLLLMSALAWVGVGQAYAADTGPYVRLDAGASFLPDGPKPEGVTKNTRDASALFGGGVGYRINKHIRTDVTINYAAESKGRIESPTDTKDQKIHILTGLVNAYYDVDTFYGFTPYVGAGVGVARVETGNSDVTGVAGQVGIGTSYAVTDKISADLGYRYLMTDAEQTVSYNFDVKKKRIDAHQVTLGLRYNF